MRRRRRTDEHERGVLRAGEPEPGHHAAERPPAPGAHPGQQVQERLLVDRRDRGLVHAEPQREAVACEQRADARGVGHGALERLAALGPEHRLSVVEVDQPGRPAGRLVLTDHQRAGPRDRGPVDPAEVVAFLVAAHRVVLLAAAQQLARPRAADVRDARRLGRGTEVLDLRRHEELVTAVQEDAPPCQAEGVGPVDRHRSDHVAAAGVRDDRVGHPLERPRRPRHDHARGPAEGGRQPVLEQQERGLGRAFVRDVEPDGHAGAGRHARLGQVALHVDRARPPADERARDERQQQQPDRDGFEARRPEDACRDPHPDARQGDRDAARGEHQSRSATGTSTVANRSVITDDVSRPAIAASAVTISRCVSTGAASAFTSSGIT